MENSGLDTLEAITRAVLITEETNKVVGSQLGGLLMVNAVYAAYSFYQDRKGSALTLEEMEEIQAGVMSETGRYAQALMDVLCSKANV